MSKSELSESDSNNLYENYTRENKDNLPADFIRQQYPAKPTYIGNKKIGTGEGECKPSNINNAGTNCPYEITYTNNDGYSKIVSCDPIGVTCSEQVCNKKSGNNKKCYDNNTGSCNYRRECGIFNPTWQVWYDSDGNIITPSDITTPTTKIECNSTDKTCKHIVQSTGEWGYNSDDCSYTDYCGVNTSNNITVKGLCTTTSENSVDTTTCNVYQCDYSKQNNTCYLVNCDSNYEKCGIFGDPNLTPASCETSISDDVCFNQNEKLPILVKTAKCSNNSCKITECDSKHKTCVSAICGKNGNTCGEWNNCNYTSECTPAKKIFSNISGIMDISTILKWLIPMTIFIIVMIIILYYSIKYKNSVRTNRNNLIQTRKINNTTFAPQAPIRQSPL